MASVKVPTGTREVFMKIIIEVKGTETLSRIADFGNHLNALEHNPNDMDQMFRVTGFDDVIESIDKEW